MSLFFLVDMSASGRFGSKETTKQDAAAQLTSLLAFSAVKNNDRVSLILYTEEVELYMGGVQTANGRIAESLDVIRAEWARMAAEGLSVEDLARAKTYLTGSFPLRFTSSRRIAGMLAGIQLETLGIDYLDRRNGFIEAVTGADVRRVARKWLDADTLTFVVVGDPEGLGGG